MASKPDTITTITISTVASRPHWNSAVASVISSPSPPAPIRPRMVESRMLNSQMYRWLETNCGSTVGHTALKNTCAGPAPTLRTASIAAMSSDSMASAKSLP